MNEYLDQDTIIIKSREPFKLIFALDSFKIFDSELKSGSSFGKSYSTNKDTVFFNIDPDDITNSRLELIIDIEKGVGGLAGAVGVAQIFRFERKWIVIKDYINNSSKDQVEFIDSSIVNGFFNINYKNNISEERFDSLLILKGNIKSRVIYNYSEYSNYVDSTEIGQGSYYRFRIYADGNGSYKEYDYSAPKFELPVNIEFDKNLIIDWSEFQYPNAVDSLSIRIIGIPETINLNTRVNSDTIIQFNYLGRANIRSTIKAKYNSEITLENDNYYVLSEHENFQSGFVTTNGEYIILNNYNIYEYYSVKNNRVVHQYPKHHSGDILVSPSGEIVVGMWDRKNYLPLIYDDPSRFRFHLNINTNSNNELFITEIAENGNLLVANCGSDEIISLNIQERRTAIDLDYSHDLKNASLSASGKYLAILLDNKSYYYEFINQTYEEIKNEDFLLSDIIGDDYVVGHSNNELIIKGLLSNEIIMSFGPGYEYKSFAKDDSFICVKNEKDIYEIYNYLTGELMLSFYAPNNYYSGFDNYFQIHNRTIYDNNAYYLKF